MQPPDNLYKKVVIKDVIPETDGVKTFVLSYVDNIPIKYTSGQFITFVFFHHNKEERRSFSICSSPVLNEPFAFTVKRVDNGAYSRILIDKAKTGDILYTTGASGLFVLPQNLQTYKQAIFFAAGIGITPVFSLIKTLLYANDDTDIVLIYSNRRREDVVFYNELQELENKFKKRFNIAYLYSTAFDLARARLSKGLMPELLKEYARTEKNKMLFYTCGPSDYMRMTILALEENGIHSEQIKKENFNTNTRVAVKTEPPDKTPRKVKVKMANREYSFIVSYPDSILQAAKKAGVSLPYSCETGRCGSCAATCDKGKIWLSYNEVLMEADIAKGKTLTCVGHPVGGDVAIEIL